VQARSGALFRFAWMLTGDYGYAEDLLQTALAKAYTAWSRISRPEAAEAYVRKVMVTTAISWWRRRAWRNERPRDDVPEVDAASAADAITERDPIWAAIRSLPPGQRAMVVLRYYEDLTEIQTAELLGCSVANVKSQTHLALKALRSRLVSNGATSLPQGEQ
jgi:RNA polymerase sigma-70 factor (sigma-E family)